jgi:hypothetical protein
MDEKDYSAYSPSDYDNVLHVFARILDLMNDV